MEEDEKYFIFTSDGRKVDFSDKKKKVCISVLPVILEDDACENVAKYIENNDELESLRIIAGDFNVSKDDFDEVKFFDLIGSHKVDNWDETDADGKSTYINDAYNASYDSVKAALEYLYSVKGNKKIAILGDMLEMGEYETEMHEKVGEEVLKK